MRIELDSNEMKLAVLLYVESQGYTAATKVVGMSSDGKEEEVAYKLGLQCLAGKFSAYVEVE